MTYIDWIVSAVIAGIASGYAYEQIVEMIAITRAGF